jgi:hypothetical protein
MEFALDVMSGSVNIDDFPLNNLRVGVVHHN